MKALVINTRKKHVIKTIFSIAITGGILGFILSRIKIEDFLLTISEISFTTLILIFLIMVLLNVLRAYRFKVLLPDKGISFSRLIGVVFFCNLITNIVPLGIGQISYPILFKRYFTVSLTQGISILLLARIFDLIAICFIFLLSAYLAQGIPESMNYAMNTIIVVVSIIVSTILLLVIFIIFCSSRTQWLQSFLYRTSNIRNRLLRKLVYKITEAVIALNAINSKPIFLKVAISSLGIWVLMYFIGFTLMKGLNVNIDIATCFVGQSFPLITNILPIQGFAGFGSFEGSWAGAFFLLGIPEVLAISSGIIVHLIILIYQALLGLTGVLMIRRVSLPADK